MRRIWSLCGLAFFAASTTGLAADDLRSITVPEVEVRSGASTEFYATSKLRQGQIVKVKKEENGWLAIEPPPDSFSWINTLFLDHKPTQPGHAYVKGANAPIRVGSSLSKDEPKVSQVKLSAGTVVYVIDPVGAANTDGNWLPISPPAQEVRYIPADAVRQAAQVHQTVNASPGATPPGTFAPPGSAAPHAHDSADDQLLAQAQAAERRGDSREARRLYHQLMLQTKDHDLQLRCANCEHFVSQGHTASVPTGYQPGVPSTATYPSPGYPTVQPIAPPSAPGTSSYTYYRDSMSRQPVQAIPASRITQAPAPQGEMQWSGPGFLRRTRVNVDGKVAYALETPSGQLMLYATAQGATNLEPYVGKRVDLLGPVSYRGDMYHKYYMPVAQVREMP